VLSVLALRPRGGVQRPARTLANSLPFFITASFAPALTHARSMAWDPCTSRNALFSKAYGLELHAIGGLVPYHPGKKLTSGYDGRCRAELPCRGNPPVRARRRGRPIWWQGVPVWQVWPVVPVIPGPAGRASLAGLAKKGVSLTRPARPGRPGHEPKSRRARNRLTGGRAEPSDVMAFRAGVIAAFLGSKALGLRTSPRSDRSGPNPAPDVAGMVAIEPGGCGTSDDQTIACAGKVACQPPWQSNSVSTDFDARSAWGMTPGHPIHRHRRRVGTGTDRDHGPVANASGFVKTSFPAR
jgi:hypothetical protein